MPNILACKAIRRLRRFDETQGIVVRHETHSLRHFVFRQVAFGVRRQEAPPAEVSEMMKVWFAWANAGVRAKR